MAGRRRQIGKLSDEDRDLWEKVVENADRLRPAIPILTAPPTPIISVKAPRVARINSFEIGAKTIEPQTTAHLFPGLDEMFAATSPNMDKRNFDRLKKGKMAVDGTLDLHGLTLAEAHPRLNAFVRGAYASHKRLLLVITGKGKSSSDHSIMPVRRGVLRHQVPQWLSMAPLAPLVLQVTQATQKHGGGGAYYVYLRRQR